MTHKQTPNKPRECGSIPFYVSPPWNTRPPSLSCILLCFHLIQAHNITTAQFKALMVITLHLPAVLWNFLYLNTRHAMLLPVTTNRPLTTFALIWTQNIYLIFTQSSCTFWRLRQFFRFKDNCNKGDHRVKILSEWESRAARHAGQFRKAADV